MADSSPPRATPKRKRGDEEPPLSPISTHTQFSFHLPETKGEDDGSASPRTNVAHRFRGLALEGGGGVTQQHRRSESFDSMMKEDDDELMMRKRQKPDIAMQEAAEVLPTAVGVTDSEGKTVPQPVPDAAFFKNTHGGASLGGSLRHSYPSISRLSDSKSRVRKRTGTPPLIGGKNKNGDVTAAEGEGEREIVEPVRAALTWHEDEITVYDPEDADDDGTGINGIGFKPTPALAYARAQRRKQQLAEYRKREESDARAKRNQRRRGGSPGMSIKLDSEASAVARRVRFMESSESATVATTG